MLDWTKVNENEDFPGEASKARARRLREGWFEKYIFDPGIDIGCGDDALNHTFRRFDWSRGDGDATIMEGIPDNTFMTVFASHVLEHLKYPQVAIRKWYDILKPGGYLLIAIPNRDLYERKRIPPSNWNPEHVYFWLPEEEEPPCTKSLKHEVLRAVPEANIVDLRIISEGYDFSVQKNEHATGEYSIECVIKK